MEPFSKFLKRTHFDVLLAFFMVILHVLSILKDYFGFLYRETEGEG